MYERRFESRQMRQIRQEVVHIRPASAKERGVHMSEVCSRKEKESKIDRFADGVLNFLYRLESDRLKNDICFTLATIIVAFYGWRVLRAWIF